MKYSIFLFFSLVTINGSIAAQDGCYALLEKDTLTIGNHLIERKFRWNGGNLITYSLTDKQNNQCWINNSKTPDFYISDQDIPESASWTSRYIAENMLHPRYFECEIIYSLGSLVIKRIYKLYANSPTIACQTYIKGQTLNTWTLKNEDKADLKNIEFAKDATQKQLNPILDQLSFSGKHWDVKSVEFFDVTDRNNNLVLEYNTLSYRKNFQKGNILFATNKENEKGFFILKEAPCSNVQLANNGADFISEFGKFSVIGMGIDANDLKKDEWTRTYGCVIGVYGMGELDKLSALRIYQKNIRKTVVERDEMVLMNTWGDRSQDSKVNEAFCLNEVAKAAQLGISHFQIDDGWQTGRSPNSAMPNGTFKNIWSNPNYWKPDKVKYPLGLHPIVKKGKELGVEICLWFNPSIENDYEDWQKDAQAMIDLYNEYGIRIFKIDGLSIPTKLADIRLRKLFDSVLEQTNNEVVFNLDATAGRRGGYHYLNEYGNIFLENRYTDWQNYYPYWTLRNLWQLSKYVPAEKLQIEFLNKWRNFDKYGDDLFAPKNYSFDYLFAITMAAQPLAWFEGSNLPEAANDIKKNIVPYRTIQHDFHNGIILPIGNEPSAKSWTGFQSINKNSGYLLIFRENNVLSSFKMNTWLMEGKRIKCVPIMGSGKAFESVAGKNGTIEFTLPLINSFVLYKYSVQDNLQKK